MKIKNATMAVCLSLCATSALADVAVFATHNIVSAVEDAAGTQVTIDVTVRNDGEALSGLNLMTMDPFFAVDRAPAIEVGTLAEGETRVIRWTTNSPYAPEFFNDPFVLAFQGIASATAGEQAFPVVSNGGAQ